MQYVGKMPGEFFAGNCESPRDYLGELKTLRYGKPALDIGGKELDSRFSAMFIHERESAKYSEIMEARRKRIAEGKTFAEILAGKFS